MTIRQIIGMLAITAAGLSGSATASDTIRISREECVAIALQENPTIRVADMEVKRMDYSKREVLANLFPSIDFSGSYQRAIELQTISMAMGGQSQKFKMGMDNNWNFGFSAQMPLINAQLWKSIQMSETQILATLEESRASRLDLVNNINKSYYALLLAIASRDVVRDNYNIAQMNHDIFKKQFEQGTASEYDVLRSSVQVKNYEPELLQADIAIKQSSLMLKILMGMDSEVTVMPDITLKDMQREMYGYQLGVERNLSRNTQLRSLDLQTKLLKQNLASKKLAWVPTLGVNYGLNWMAMSNGNAFKNQEFNPYSSVSLGLSIPIFNGLGRLNSVKQAKIQVKEMEFQRENLVNNLNMQVDVAMDNINRQVRQIASSEEGMKQARKAYEIMQKSFDIGAASYLDLRDAELANTAAQLSYHQAIYNFLVSTSELDTLLGKEDALGIPATTSSTSTSTSK